MDNYLRKELLDQVKQVILPRFNQMHARIYLFGSWARNQERLSSDIDVAVESNEPIPRAIFVEVREALEESRIPYQVDLVNLGEASDALKEEVRREGILWSD